MKQVWRWFGPKDYIHIRDIAQTGAQGIVHALHEIPTGEVWNKEDIRRRQEMIRLGVPEGYELSWDVVESVNIHEEIKRGGAKRDYYIEQYIETIRNLGACGLSVLCYNFMPVLDWTRTHLNYVLTDGTQALKFDWVDVTVFDVYVLKRPQAELDYSEELLHEARLRFTANGPEYAAHLESVVLQGLPGTDEKISLDLFKKNLSAYKELSKTDLQENLRYFLQAIVPVAEESGVRLCCHPDDPPFTMFGLPRIVSTLEDIRFLLSSADSEYNGLTYCTGSLGANPSNDLLNILRETVSKVHFVHLRNVAYEEHGSFYEADHLSGSVPMVDVMEVLIDESKRRHDIGRKDADIPYRPDHGHLFDAEVGKELRVPGYSWVGRMRGLAELRGVEIAVKTIKNRL